MTNANVEKKKKKKKKTKRQKHKSYTEVNSYKKWNKHRGIKEFLQKKLYWHNGKDVTMSCRMQTTVSQLKWRQN